MAERRSVEIALDTKQKMTGLKIVTGLNATNEFSEAAIETVVWNIQIAAGPCSAHIGADIKSRPVVGRCDDGSSRCFCRHVGSARNDACADCKERGAAK